jgi:transposase
MDEKGQRGSDVRVEHDRVQFRQFLDTLPTGSPIALESIGSWYWMIEEMEQAGHVPFLTHPRKARLMMGMINKSDKLDAGGLALLLHNGTLPSVWIPPGELRDQRELPRMRMAITRVRTMLKNRIHADLAKYAIYIEEVSDIFGVRGRVLLEHSLDALPPYTRRAVETQLQLLDQVEEQIRLSEQQIKAVIKETAAMKLLITLPGFGPILSIVAALEVGDVHRFPGPEQLASYGGTVPRLQQSGTRRFHGRVRPDVNRYLKWALIEAANMIVLNQKPWANRHVVRLYRRIRERHGHAKAVVAVARHLAEATYWVLKKGEPYLEPTQHQVLSSTRK